MFVASHFEFLLHFSKYTFFFNDTATTEIYTLSLHDALPILGDLAGEDVVEAVIRGAAQRLQLAASGLGRWDLDDLRSEEHTSELQSRNISYAVFCLKKNKAKTTIR